MGPEAAVNAVYANKIAAIARRRRSGQRSSPTGAPSTSRTSTCSRLASDLVIDAIVEPSELRAELVRRLRRPGRQSRRFSDKRHGVPPT